MAGRIKKYCLYLLLTIPLTGCGAPLLVGGVAAVTAASGTYMYIGGELKTDHPAEFDRVWAACEKTVAQMRGTDVKPYREIGKGTISAFISDEKVTISVKYKARNLTTVGIRVGAVGNKASSQLLHDRVADNIKKN